MSLSSITQEELLVALEKALPDIADKHDEQASPWNPHDWIPWDDGKNFAFLGGEDYTPEQGTDNAELEAALLALLLTKDNLPSFHRLLSIYFPNFSDTRRLIGVWTAEDNRHAIALRDFLVVSRLIDPQVMEDRRRVHVTAGYMQHERIADTFGPLEILTLLAVHELQCVRFIERLLTVVDDSRLATLLEKIRDDDRLQATTFIAMINAGISADIERAVLAVDAIVAGIEPIGFDVADFDAGRAAIAAYSSPAETAAVVSSLVSGLGLADLGGLRGDVEQARQRILAAAR